METDTNSLSTSAETLRMLSSAILKASRQELLDRLDQNNIDMPPHQFLLLYRIRKQTLTLTEISHKMCLDPSTLAPAVEALVRRGLIQRDRDPQDRRRAPLSVTQAGVDLLAAGWNTDEPSILIRSLALLGEEKSQQLLDLLHELVTTLATVSQEIHGSNIVLWSGEGKE